MGNTSKKLAENCQLLSRDEQKLVAATFKAASRNHEKIKEADLIVSGFVDPECLNKYWGSLLDPRFAQYLNNFLFGFGNQKSETCTFNRFAELYVFNVRGTPDQKMALLYNSLGKDYNDTVELPYQLIKEYCESLVSTYIKMLKSSQDISTQAWLSKEFRARPQHVQALGEAVAAGVGADAESPPQVVTARDASRWLQQDTLLMHISELVLTTLYGQERQTATGVNVAVNSILAEPQGIDSMPSFPAFIDLCHIVWINSHLPVKHRHKWRFLYSSDIHGESFSTMAGRIEDQGPSVLIIEDNSGHIFGGYASESWHPSPNWYGQDDSFLFTLAPKMRVYQTTGYNNHYQYINYNTKTLPNAILMGGQFDFAALSIPADPFGQGASVESCSTYKDYRRLSKEQRFKLANIEVWGVGDKPVDETESDEQGHSILDKNPDAKALLEIAGKTRHSDGFREPPPDN